MRRRALLILAAMLPGMMLSGVALAKNITGTEKADKLKGTPNMDQIYGLGGPDYIAGKKRADGLYGRGKDEVRAGNSRDRVFGGRDRDRLYGGGGNDRLSAADGHRDAVNCGLGTDKAYVDERDRVNRDCEKVFGAGRPTPAVENGRIAYSGYDGNDYEIYTINSSGGDKFQVTNNNRHDRSPSYSPDGKRIAYTHR
jgi:WD40 repeat protein/hemolysin type calcium-binding protein